MVLNESIRYANGDPVERWLYDLLCLDATNVSRISSGCPLPEACDLYYINRDTLFSYHKASEAFLHRVMALYVSSHYKVCILSEYSTLLPYLVYTLWLIQYVCLQYNEFYAMHLQFEVCSVELVLVITRQNLCYRYKKFSQALVRMGFVEHATGYKKKEFLFLLFLYLVIRMLWVINFSFQNTPNDLQLLSDAPAHHVFALLGPVDPNQTSLPEVLCILQVSRSFVSSWFMLIYILLFYCVTDMV